MARTTIHTFGPGALEGLTLRVWTAPNRTRACGARTGDSRRLVAHLVGTYDVSAPSGMYRVRVDEREDQWESEGLLTRARQGDQEAADELAHMLLDWGLENWADPAEEAA